MTVVHSGTLGSEAFTPEIVEVDHGVTVAVLAIPGVGDVGDGGDAAFVVTAAAFASGCMKSPRIAVEEARRLAGGAFRAGPTFTGIGGDEVALVVAAGVVEAGGVAATPAKVFGTGRAGGRAPAPAAPDDDGG